MTQANKIDSLLRVIRRLGRMNTGSPEYRLSEELYLRMLDRYYTRLSDAQNNGGFIAAHGVFFPTEILYAMGLAPMHTEMTTWMMALFTGNAADILAAGAQAGLVPEICSAHRGLAGAFATGALPRPDVILWGSLVCDNTAKAGELLTEIAGCPGFLVDQPFQQSDGEINYLVGEYKSLIRFLEEKSGRKLDEMRLAASVASTRREIELYREIGALRKSAPSPFRTDGFLKLLITYYLYPGQPESIEFLEAVRDELSAMVKAGKGAVPKERFRLLTLFLPPVHMIGSLTRLYQERGAVSVAEPFFTTWGEARMDPSKPLESIARKSFIIPETCSMYGPLRENTVEDIVKTARDYRVDGAVYYANNACRHTCATVKVFKDALAEVDVPMLTVDCDVVDPAFSTQEEVRSKLEQFFELLEDR